MPDVLTEADISDFERLNGGSVANRLMFDRRTGKFGDQRAYIFRAIYSRRKTIEVQVNVEFSKSEASQIAEFYAEVVGRLPLCLTEMVKTMWIHKGNNLFGGGNNNLLIHEGKGLEYIAAGTLEEILIHEGVHSSLDPLFSEDRRWKNAQKSDGAFISDYARDFPEREDLAESFLPYLAVRYRSDRISSELYDKIFSVMKDRIGYFDSQRLNVWPWDQGSEQVDAHNAD